MAARANGIIHVLCYEINFPLTLTGNKPVEKQERPFEQAERHSDGNAGPCIKMDQADD